MIEIRKADLGDIPVIQQIAYRTWPHTFGAILSPSQIAYMLDWMYTTAALQEQMEKEGHLFFLAIDGDDAVGFVGCQPNYKGQATIKIHKLYILPNQQGKGVGRELLNKVTEIAHEHQNITMSLNVNRNNNALHFYRKVGFEVVAKEDIDIGNGFLMEDFIMEKPVMA